MSSKQSNGFEKIKISDKLDEVVENAIKRAKKDKEKNNIKSNLTNWNKNSICLTSVNVNYEY